MASDEYDSDHCCCPLLCLPFRRRRRRGSTRARGREELLAGGRRKYGPAELAEVLEDAPRIFASVKMIRYVAGAPNIPATDSPPSSASPSDDRRRSAGISGRVIDNYIDRVCEAMSDHTLVVRGPVRAVPEEEAAEVLAGLESLLLDETDYIRLRIRGLRLVELEVTPAIACFANAMVSGGVVESISFVGCSVSVSCLRSELQFYRHGTLAHVAFRNCSLADQHLSVLIERLQETSEALRSMQSLQLTGSYSERKISELLLLLLDQSPQLRALTLPRRHADLVRRHPLSDACPDLLLNEKKVRNWLT